MADHMAQALLALRDAQEEMDGTTEATLYAAASAHAAIDAAETLRRIEGRLDLATFSAGVTEARGPLPPDDVIRACEILETLPPVSTPARTPQVGEVWEDPNTGQRVEITASDSKGYYGVPAGSLAPGCWVGADWRRVSPAPAPLTEREVSEEVRLEIAANNAWMSVTGRVEGVEPATDGEIADWSLLIDTLGTGRAEHDIRGNLTDHTAARLIARVRAEQARADDLYRELLATENRLEARVEQAENQIEQMLPVVEAVNGIIDSEGRYFLTAEPAKRLETAVRAYREATRGE